MLLVLVILLGIAIFFAGRTSGKEIGKEIGYSDGWYACEKMLISRAANAGYDTSKIKEDLLQ